MRDTIDMAREADEHADMEWPLRPRGDHWKQCRDERFAALVRADEQKKWQEQTAVEIHEAVLDEREACAKVAEDVLYGTPGCGKAAAAIRARGQA
jgi:hypothetical protein